jgi:hypothetical protein
MCVVMLQVSFWLTRIALLPVLLLLSLLRSVCFATAGLERF